MIIRPDLIKKLRNYFSLNIYETKVWLALMSKGIASAGEIAELSGVPRSRTYDVLESLEKQGFAIAKLGKPAKFIAVEPRKIIEKLKKNTEVDAKEKVRVLADLRDTKEYNELEELYKEGISPVKREDLSGAIKGRLNISSHTKEILENAAEEIIVCSDQNYLLKNQKFFKMLFGRLNKSNVNVLIGVYGAGKEVERINNIFNIKAKPINVQGRFFIVDGKEMLLILSDPEKDESEFAIWINSDFLAGSIAYLFKLAMGKNNNNKSK